MEIIQIKKDKFKILLHSEDLKRYNLSTESFMALKFYNNPVILDLFNLFPFNSKNITFDMYYINNSDFVIFINIISNYFFYTYNVYKNKNIIKIKKNDFFICSFSDLNIFCDFFKLLNNYFLKNNFIYIFNFFELYEYNNIYFLIIKNINYFYCYFNFIFLFILEFTNNYYFSEIFLFRIYEFGNLIFNYKNINNFKKYLK